MSKPKKQENKKCKQCVEYKSGWQRALADYENLKKQTAREKENFAKFANLNLIMELIPVYNNFKLSFEHLPEELKDNTWIQGVDHIEKQFIKVLEDNGLTQIKPEVGSEFNPQEMEAVQQNSERSQQEAEDKIKKVAAVGYKLKDKVVVPAKVIVE